MLLTKVQRTGSGMHRGGAGRRAAACASARCCTQALPYRSVPLTLPAQQVAAGAPGAAPERAAQRGKSGAAHPGAAVCISTRGRGGGWGRRRRSQAWPARERRHAGQWLSVIAHLSTVKETKCCHLYTLCNISGGDSNCCMLGWRLAGGRAQERALGAQAAGTRSSGLAKRHLRS